MDVVSKIKKILKKKKESIVVDMYLKDYEKSNFYFALVFNRKIEKFKVLYVPIDAIGEGEDIEEYFCYQFIFLHTVNYILTSIHENEKNIDDKNSLIRHSTKLDSYYIEINTNVHGESFKYTFTQYIDKDFLFLFDVVVVLFEHLPNIVSELCTKLLKTFQEDEDIVYYDGSFDFNLKEDTLDKLFLDRVINNCKYKYFDISFLEEFGNRYYAIINDNLIIIDTNLNKGILNVCCGDLDVLGDEVYIVLKAIQKKKFYSFYRLEVKEGSDEKYYLCYGIEDENFLVITEGRVDIVPLSLICKKKVKMKNCSSYLDGKIKRYLEDKYEDFKVKELMDYLIDNKVS